MEKDEDEDPEVANAAAEPGHKAPESTMRLSWSSRSDSCPEHFRGPAVGSSLPFGPHMYQSADQVVRMKDVGVGRRIILVGVIGSFTPDCWNRHLYLVLKHYDYLKERGVNHIICISTSDPFVHNAWGEFLGCYPKVLMWSDPLALYTKALGLNFIVPWLDPTERSKRYIILAEDMVITKITRSVNDSSFMRWDCEHLIGAEFDDDDDDDDDADSQDSDV